MSEIAGELAEIHERLDAIGEHMAWFIRVDQRFSKGQRVEFSQKARRSGNWRRMVDRKAIVKGIENGFCLVVQIDGFKSVRYFHHSFFNPVSGPKLF